MARSTTVVSPGRAGTAQRPPVSGDLRWDGERWRRWTGRRWTMAAYSLDPAALQRPERFDQRPPIAESRRRRALELAVEDVVTENGARVVHVGPSGTVVGRRRRVSHGFHFLLTLATGGLWGVVWVAMALARREDRWVLACDPWGHVWATPTAPST
ncbi:hypothetical protein [Nocardioides pantholopis]|uniref:hypothetical protein n=1 Tax=Nocardioides pantholopis TaxID=2483798 RepID=UPI000FD9E257|nr:hypothetical protein [Nocardioides pantholopis]